MKPVQMAYLGNIIILLAVALPTLFGLYPVDAGLFPESPGWRMITGAMWTAILVMSFLGLTRPLRFSPVLLMQLIYKSLWLLLFAAPRVLHGRAAEVPRGIAGTFLVIVLVWPFLIPWRYLLEEGQGRPEPAGTDRSV